MLDELRRRLGLFWGEESPAADLPEEPAGPGLTKAQQKAVVKALERADGFDLVDTLALDGLVEKGASILSPIPDLLFCQHEIPEEAFYVALTGKLRFGKKGGAHTWEHAAPAAVGLRELIEGREIDADVSAAPVDGAAAQVVKISSAAYRDLLLSDPDFRRAVVRGGSGRAESIATPKRASKVYLIATDSALDERVRRLVPSLTDLLAETIATHLYDEVLVIHLVPEGEAGRADVIVEHRWKWPGESRDEAALPRAEGRTTLIEHELEERFARPRPVRINYRSRALPASGRLDELLKSERVVAGDERVILVDLGAAEDRIRYTSSNVVYLWSSPTASPALRLLSKASLIRTAILGPPTGELASSSRPAWPLGAVRLRFARGLLAALDSPARGGASRVPVSIQDLALALPDQEATIATFQRWARAVTGRRVGLSLGGGGPYGFRHGAFIQSLVAAKIPVDMVSGSSVGATVGAYYCVLGEAGLQQFESLDKHAFVDLLKNASLQGAGDAFEALLKEKLGDLDLRELEIPFFPVVTDALTGAEWDIRRTSVALGVRASGSLPPLFPATVIENRRYLDGGLVANVPSRVLRQEGAALVIASNPVCDVDKQARAELSQAPSSGLIGILSEGKHRVTDLLRMVQMLFGALGDTQIGSTDVAFRPRDTDGEWLAPLVLLLLGGRVPPGAHGEDGARLDLAQNLATNAWRRLLGNPPSRVWLDEANDTIRVDVRSRILFEPRSPRLDPSCFELMQELADLITRLDIRTLTIQVTASSLELARSRAVMLRRQLALRDIPIEVDGDERVSIAFRAGTEESVELIRVEARKEEAARALRHRRARALTASARELLGKADPDLVRMLAIEAASIERSREIDALLRDSRLLPPGRLHAFPGDGEVFSLAWHPLGRILAVASYSGWVRVLDAARGEVLAEYQHAGANQRITSSRRVTWSPDGKRLLSTGEDRRIYLSEVDTDGRLLGAPVSIGDTGPWTKLGASFSPDGARLLTTCLPPPESPAGLAAAACLAIRSVPDGAVLHVLEHDSVVSRAVWDAQGSRVIAGTVGGTLSIWDATTGALMSTRPSPGMGAVVHLAWSPSARSPKLAVAFEQGALVYRDSALDPSSVFECLGHEASILRIAWSPRGDWVVTASLDHTARIWDVDAGALRMVLRADASVVGTAFYPDPDHDLVATWTTDGTSQIWDGRSGERLAVLTGQAGSMRVADFSPRGSMFATGSKDGTTCIWIASGRPPKLEPARRRDGRTRRPLNGIAFCPGGGDWALVSGDDGSVRLWDPKRERTQPILAPREVTEMADRTQPTRAAAAFSPDGKRLAFLRCPDEVPTLKSVDDPTAVLPLLQPPRARFPYQGNRTSYVLHWSPDGRYLAVNFSRTWTVWDVTSGEPVRWQSEEGAASWDPNVNVVRWMDWDPAHPGRFAVARWRVGNKTVEIWDLHRDPDAPPERFCRGTAEKPIKDAALRIAWSPDGSRMAAGHNDGVTRIFDPTSGELVAHIQSGPVRPVTWVAWSPGREMKYLATGDFSGRVTVLAHVPASGGVAESYVEVSQPGDSPPHNDAIRHLLWSRDGTRLVSSDVAGVVAVWELDTVAHRGSDAPTWKVTARLDSHREAVIATAFDPEEKSLLIAGADGTARYEPVDFERLRDVVGAQLSRREMTAEEWSRYMHGDRRPTWPA